MCVAEVRDILEAEDPEAEKAREQLYKDIGYVEEEDWKYPKEVWLNNT